MRSFRGIEPDARAATPRRRREWAYTLMTWVQAAQRRCEQVEMYAGAGRFLGYWLALSSVASRGASESLLLDLAKTIDVSIRVMFCDRAMDIGEARVLRASTALAELRQVCRGAMSDLSGYNDEPEPCEFGYRAVDHRDAAMGAAFRALDRALGDTGATTVDGG